MPTAWRAEYTYGEPTRTFGLNSEMDALPDIGHACGHNLIAIAGLGAFLALRDVMQKHKINGKIVLIGTPAEEGDAGKVKLLEAGACESPHCIARLVLTGPDDGIQACMMLHPGRGEPGTGAVIRSLAYQPLRIVYTGKPAHAGVAPWEGINALDAATIAYTSISTLRQQVKPDCRYVPEQQTTANLQHPGSDYTGRRTRSQHYPALDRDELPHSRADGD